MDDPLLGQILGGNYRLDYLLGRGGMAQVYCGWDVNLERPVAVKIIDARYRDSPAYAARFVREARAVASWRHENIIQIYYAGEQDGLYYFVMEFIKGLDLRTLLNQYATDGELMPIADILRLGRAVADALDYAHHKGIIHRDVKPSNVMVAEDGRVVLTDFGLAMDIYQGSLGEVFGSPHYIAPEQARSSAAAVPQSDLYSLGVMLYEMLTGVVPFDDPSSTTVALQHITQAPPSPCELNPNLSQETEAVLLKALSKSPGERYPTGKALLEALEVALKAAAPADTFAQVAALELPPLPPGVAAHSPAPSISTMSVADKVTTHLKANPQIERTCAPEAADGDLIGQQLDDFRLEALLGHGGMARVYRGLELTLNRRVAIKVIDAPFRADPDYLMRFEREAQAIARLEHPHIVRLYRYGKDKGLLYMAMQFIEGADLADVLESYRQAGDTIEPYHAQRIIGEICDALDYAHSQGIIHRDIKPANVMITPQDHAILTDFGLALLTEAGTHGMIFGSPHYIAPEQAVSSANVVPQTDLYAVGVILYEMFTGQVPFDAESPLDIAMLHLTETPPAPRELRPDLSPAVEAVILKAIAKEPAERYATGKELSAALDHALEATPAVPQNRINLQTLYERVTLPHAAPAPEAAPPQQPAVAPMPVLALTVPKILSSRILLYLGAGLLACLLIVALIAGGIYLGTKGAQKGAGDSVPTATLELSTPTSPGAKGAATSTAMTGTTDRATATPAPTAPAKPVNTTEATPIPTAPATATPASGLSQSYNLRFARQKKDGLFIMNAGPEVFALAPLLLNTTKGSISGAIWGLETLAPGECVVAWKDERDPKLPKDLECTLVGVQAIPDKEQQIWGEQFTISYGDTVSGTCEKEAPTCTIP